MLRGVGRAAIGVAFAIGAAGFPVAAMAAPPANDDFPGQTLLSPSFTMEGANVDATGETGEPNHAGVSLVSGCSDSTTPDSRCNPSVWYTGTAPATGTAVVDTCGSDYDTTLAVYTGSSVGALTEVGSNDDHTGECPPEGSGVESSVSFSATMGTEYHFAVSGCCGSTGNFVLRLNPAPDSTAPDTSITGGPSGNTTSTDADFTFDSSEMGFGFQCSLDGSPFSFCISPDSWGGFSPGPHTYSVRAVDPAGNVDASPAVRNWTVEGGQPPPPPPPPPDTAAPVASISVPKQKLGKVAKSGKLVENVTTNEAGAITAQAVLAKKLAKRLGLPPNGQVFTSATAKPAIVAKGRGSASKAGTYKVTLKLTKKARKKLAKLKKVSLVLRTRVTDKAGNRRLVKKTITLKR